MEELKFKLAGIKKNYLEAHFACNEFFQYGGEERKSFDEEFFGAEFFERNRYKIGNLKFADLVSANGIKTCGEFTADTGIRIPAEKFEVIRRCALELLEGGGRGGPSDTVTITTFCNRFKKGSKPFRRILMGMSQDEIPRNINTYAENSQTIIGASMGKMINSLWGFSYFSIDMRMFLFKMHNNTLGTFC
jgi:hypothetical protein